MWGKVCLSNMIMIHVWAAMERVDIVHRPATKTKAAALYHFVCSASHFLFTYALSSFIYLLHSTNPLSPYVFARLHIRVQADRACMTKIAKKGSIATEGKTLLPLIAMEFV